MKTKKIIVLISATVLSIIAVWYFVGSRKSDLAKYIPNNAIGVVKIDPISIGRKIDFDAVKKMEFYKPMMDEMEKEFKKFSKLMSNPKEMGISIKDNIYFFGERQIEGSGMDLGIVMGVSNANSIKSFIDGFAKEAHLEYEKSGNLNTYSIQTSDDEGIILDNFAIVWNDEVCLFYKNDSAALNTAKKIITQNVKNSMFEVKAFSETEDKGGDMSVYINYAEYMKMIEKFSKVQITNGFPDKLKKIYENVLGLDIIINFNDDNINTEMHQYVKDEKLGKEYQFIGDKGFSNESLEFVSPNGKMLIGFGAMLNMKNIFALLKYFPEYQSSMKDICLQIGITEAELEGLFDGSISFALSKLNSKQVEEKVYDYSDFNPETGEYSWSMQPVTRVVPVMTAQLGFQNEKIWNKILEKLEISTNGALKPQDNVLTVPFGTMPIHMVFVKNKLILTNDDVSAKLLAKNKTWNNPLEKDKSELFSKNSMVYFVDLDLKNYGEGKLAQFLNMQEQSITFQKFKQVMSEFGNITVYGTNSSATMNLNFSEGKNNSLMRLFKIADTVAAL